MKQWLAMQWARVRRNKLLTIAGLLSGGEAIVNLGIPLPGSDTIPPLLRVSFIFAITAGSFIARLKAQNAAGKSDG